MHVKETIGYLRQVRGNKANAVTAAPISPTQPPGEIMMEQTTSTNLRELAETVYKSQSDTYAVLTKRIQEDLGEAKALLRPEK